MSDELVASITEASAEYYETHFALLEAIADNAKLKERLRILENRNQPAEYGKPVIINYFSRGPLEKKKHRSYADLQQQLESTYTLLDSIKKTIASSQQEKNSLISQIESLKTDGPSDIFSLLSTNYSKHRKVLDSFQLEFEKKFTDWSIVKGKLMQEAEEWSAKSHSTMHQAALKREEVDKQKTKVSKLAVDLRTALTSAKKLKDQLNEHKGKINLIESLSNEIEMNKIKTNEMMNKINQQKQKLKATKVSGEAANLINDLNNHIEELLNNKNEAENILYEATIEYEELCHSLEDLSKKLDIAVNDFRTTQATLFSYDSDIETLIKEIEFIKPKALSAGQKNVDLNRQQREAKIRATERFVNKKSDTIHQADRIKSSLMITKKCLKTRPENVIVIEPHSTSPRKAKTFINEEIQPPWIPPVPKVRAKTNLSKTPSPRKVDKTPKSPHNIKSPHKIKKIRF